MYIKQFHKVLKQIQTLVYLNMKDYPAMEAEIFSHSNWSVIGLSMLLQKFLYDKCTEEYVEKREENSGYKVPGIELFGLLLAVLRKVRGLGGWLAIL